MDKIKLHTLNSNIDQLPLGVMVIIPDKKPKAIVQISHDIMEYKERHIMFGEFLAKHNYLVVIHDHRGHGQSAKDYEDLSFFYTQEKDALIEDLHQITTWIKKEYPKLPLYMLGQGFGGIIAKLYLKKYDHELSGLILTGLPSYTPKNHFYLFCSKTGYHIKGDHYRIKWIDRKCFTNNNKKLVNPKTKYDWMCKNRSIIYDYVFDNECGNLLTTSASLTYYKLLIDANKTRNYQKKNKELPICILLGGDSNRNIDMNHVERNIKKFQKIGYKNIDYKVYARMRHEILNENRKRVVYQDILTFLNKQKKKQN